MPKRVLHPPHATHTLLRKHWYKALSIARILFEEEGYHTRYLQEIETFIETTTAALWATDVPENGRGPDAPLDTHAAEPNQSAACQYRIDHYPQSRFWGVYDGERLIAVTVYRKGAREVVARLDRLERALTALLASPDLNWIAWNRQPGKPWRRRAGSCRRWTRCAPQ